MSVCLWVRRSATPRAPLGAARSGLRGAVVPSAPLVRFFFFLRLGSGCSLPLAPLSGAALLGLRVGFVPSASWCFLCALRSGVRPPAPCVGGCAPGRLVCLFLFFCPSALGAGVRPHSPPGCGGFVRGRALASLVFFPPGLGGFGFFVWWVWFCCLVRLVFFLLLLFCVCPFVWLSALLCLLLLGGWSAVSISLAPCILDRGIIQVFTSMILLTKLFARYVFQVMYFQFERARYTHTYVHLYAVVDILLRTREMMQSICSLVLMSRFPRQTSRIIVCWWMYQARMGLS